MAVAVSGFHTTRLSLDDHKSSHPTSPSIFNQNSRSALPQWIECLSWGSDGSQHKRNHAKLPIAANQAPVCRIRPVSQIISCDAIHPTSSTSIDEEIDPCNKQKTRSMIQRWMGSLQKRTRQRSIEDATYGNRILPWVLALEEGTRSSKSISSTHRKSLSDSSFRFVSAVRSASTSFAESRTETALSQCQSQVDFEVEALKVPGPSFDDDNSTSSPRKVDCGSIERALQRRKILHELIYTEKSYLGLRRSVNQNLCEILQLHEEILSEVGRAILQSNDEELGQPCSAQFANPVLAKQECLDDSEPTCRGIEQATHIDLATGSLAGPQVVADVSRVFEKKMSRFFVYEEYGAKYDMLVQDIALVDQVLPGWEWNQRGLEALSVLLHSSNVPDCHSRRASTLKDLLVKPIQRICKYPLLFEELLKYTPALDCPNAHMAASSVLSRFREANFEINRVTNDPYMTTVLARTWLLQDRLVFPNMNFDSVSKDRGLRVEDADNGRGLQCHSAPFSWKVVFESNQRLFEIIMTACSLKEELEWRSRLSSPPMIQKLELCPACPFLDLNITSLGAIASSKTTPAKARLSTRRATTSCPKPPLCQVILKNTSEHAPSYVSNTTPLSISRSQSLLSTKSRVSILSPPRTDRVRLETLLADVWSREILPFPGVPTRVRGENFVRTSASTVMRKLSVMSIANSLARKTEGLRQRLSLEDPRRPATTEMMAFSDKWQPGSPIDAPRGPHAEKSIDGKPE
ncbi:hypothetical protein E4U43_000977 [Claviceps pusilla]|uniref:DH domain-containing protein n=1 Tax=Claviceps pusilla TaxID=123648 RepID=A0A9P7SZP1_9HYPO|nr:hypothetical protein E4U43_000977 [Claviceps pusilla]